MKQEIKTFVEEYNKRMDWNQEIIDGFGKGYIPSYTKDFIKENLSTGKITEEGFDLENAKLFAYEHDNLQELQAFNNETYGTTYFWLRSNETEDEYKERKQNRVRENAVKRLFDIGLEMAKLNGEKNEFERIRDGLL